MSILDGIMAAIGFVIVISGLWIAGWVLLIALIAKEETGQK